MNTLDTTTNANANDDSTVTETTRPRQIGRRVIESFACLAAVAAVGYVGTGVAAAAPAHQPGATTTTTMTITNHSNRLEWLLSSNTTGTWIVAPQNVLLPGASDTVVVSQPRTDWQRTIVNYRVGVGGSQATYAAATTPWRIDTELTGVNGGPGWITNQVQTRFPNATVHYDLW